MGNQSSKSKMGLITSEEDNLNQYSCRIARNYETPIQISPNKIKVQFANRYLYFPLPKDFLKNEFDSFGILIDNFGISPNTQESCQIIRNNTTPIRNIIDKVEYTEYHALSDNKGKFVLRINKKDIDKSIIVYTAPIIN